ncbi:MAG: ArsR/SmtB family transcription factor [Sandaracinaceae bacterium]
MDDAKLVKIFKALSHPNRLRLFDEIRERGERAYARGHECFLTDVMEALDVGAPTVSHHLKELVAADLITTERQGKFTTCRINPGALKALRTFLDRPR